MSRIATVVRIRRLQERIARGEVARGHAEVAARAGDVTRADAEAHAWAGVRPAHLGAHELHRAVYDVALDDVRAAEHRLDVAHTRAEDAVRAWTEASRRLDGVERLDERQRQAAADEAERAAGKELDDLVVMRWGASTDRPAGTGGPT